MEIYSIVLSRELDIRPAEFVTAWNSDANCRAHGEAGLTSSSHISYDPTGLLTDIVLNVTTGIAGNALYELIKHILTKKDTSQAKHIHIEEYQKRDGSRKLVIDIDEK